MQARGYSLIEMIVVICVISILLAIATLRFSDYLKSYRKEAQTRMFYDELLRARANALYQRRDTRVKLYTDRFEVYSSLIDCDTGVAPIVSQSLPFPVTWNNSGNNVDFDERGLAQNNGSICVASGDGASAVDSVVIYNTRISIGIKGKDDECNSDNIKTK